MTNMRNIKNWDDFLNLAAEMRDAQKRYFKQRNNLDECRRLEREFDAARDYIEKTRAAQMQSKLQPKLFV